MFLNVYNCIIFDEEMDLISCLNNEYLCAALTEQEMTVIVPLIADLMSCETLGEFLIASDSNTEFLMDECHVSEKMIENWSENKLSEYEKHNLIKAIDHVRSGINVSINMSEIQDTPFNYSIIDTDAGIGAGSHVGATKDEGVEIAVIGTGVHIPSGAEVLPGEMIS